MQRHASAAVELGCAEFGTILDFSESTIHSVELILDRVYGDTNRSHERLTNISLLYGAYIGEVIRKSFPHSRWIRAAGAEYGMPFIELDDAKVFPCSWCYSRVCNGPLRNVAKNYIEFRSRAVLRQKLRELSDPVERLQLLISERALSANAPLSEEELLQFETKHQITLPHDYRDFILKVSNGGIGFMDCSLTQLGRNGDAEEQDLQHVHADFLFERAWDWSLEYEDEDERDDCVDDWAGKFLYGNIIIANDAGYPGSWCLVVSGKEYGNTWLQTHGEIQPTDPRCKFSTWLEKLLLGENIPVQKTEQ